MLGLCLLGQAGIAQSTDSINVVVEKAGKVFMASKAAAGVSLGIYLDSHIYIFI